MAGSNYLDLKLDQFGLTRAPGEGRASFNLCGILNYALSNDNCLYDLTLHGAQELNAKIGAVENVYYFSYACCGTEPSADGRFQNPTDALGSMAGTGWLIGHIAGITVDGVKLEGDWLRNDGAVPVKSALYPEGEKHELSLTTRAHMSAACGMSIPLWRTRTTALCSARRQRAISTSI